ncbi:L-serine ammonia-lyase [Wenzhouxiangella marina]|uniref:L-serine dehydratase n=1 Tax=Wenzhouxiangella marina TaxID=1579979 RepID=A0A0K0XZV4_9GAMM|nr:L-serine ammonia-lyase [Wenzhouxiangella marina]AKS43166.1 L-serine dehydratase [Wenzhouxiangella marina]MBB6087149.1 L-serine dehydratase [Wenzhouxiangella marina]
MAVSIFDLFKIGIGPSSSHTVGPMRAACIFLDRLADAGVFDRVERVRVDLFGSLGHTGRGHGTDRAVLLGLEGEQPDKVDPDHIEPRIAQIGETGRLRLASQRDIPIDLRQDLIFHKRQTLPYHPNGMRFTVYDGDGEVLLERDYYSVGGGFVVNADDAAADRIMPDTTALKYPFSSGDELLAICEAEGLRISDVMLANEQAWRSEDEVREGILALWQAMKDCVQRGLEQTGHLPGGLKVLRRAPTLFRKLKHRSEKDNLDQLDWINLYALAVNEENAAGGRVVTAPTNGAAGIIPAVLHYYRRFVSGADEEGVIEFMLTAGAVGLLYKENASISGAEVGCQGEVGVACSMAAAGLTAALGGTMSQVENAAEIGMEHNLGLTCDPVGGLVQIPCIERNAMGAVKAVNATRMAMAGDGKHRVSLDKVIKTMRDTGRDMKTKYKETSRGGLAVNVIEC